MASKRMDVTEAREAPPSQYLLKIQPFSSLLKAGIEKYSSEAFDAGDYKWKLLIYPNGYKSRGGEGHISMVLTLVGTSSLPVGWSVNAVFNFFIYDRFRDKYVSFSGSFYHRIFRFHAMKLEWGSAKFIDLETFRDPSNGYLVDDACVFGVEVFVVKQSRKVELLSVTEEAVAGEFSWTVKPFSRFVSEKHESEAFTVGDYKWRIRLYPKGNGEGKGNSISAFLCLDESTLPPNIKLLVKFTLRVVDQSRQKSENLEFISENQFGPPCLVWGCQKFMSLTRLNDPKKKFLVDDTCIIEALVTLIGVVSTV